MDISAFTVYYKYRHELYPAEIRPCCREDNVVDFAVWDKGRLVFTLTRHAGKQKWVVALKNADDHFTDELVQCIGNAIEKVIADKKE